MYPLRKFLNSCSWQFVCLGAPSLTHFHTLSHPPLARASSLFVTASTDSELNGECVFLGWNTTKSFSNKTISVTTDATQRRHCGIPLATVSKRWTKTVGRCPSQWGCISHRVHYPQIVHYFVKIIF